jgi:glycosyltransferase involved in cell wall biosynthesis
VPIAVDSTAPIPINQPSRVLLVSVIIPTTLDRPAFLRAALRSVLSQTVADFEVLVIDDGSTTNLLPVLHEFDDHRIRYFRHDSRRGEAAARNTGIRSARGGYLAFLDDDDEWLPEKLRLQLELFRGCPDTVGCVYGGHVAIRARDGQELAREVPAKRGDLSSELLERNILGPPSTVMLKRECLDRVGLFDEAIAFGVDYDLWIRMAQEYHFDFVPDVVARYTIHPGQMSNDPFIIARGRADLQRKHAPRLQRDRGRDGRFYFSLGRHMAALGHRGEARRAFLKALRLNPLGFRAYVYLAASLAGPRSVSRLRRMLGRLRGVDPADP